MHMHEQQARAGFAVADAHDDTPTPTHITHTHSKMQARAGFTVADAHDKDRVEEITAQACPGHFPGFVAYR